MIASISRHRRAAAVVNPFPLVAERWRQRAHAHRHPLEPWRNERMGFAKPGSHRDRAMVALWVSTGVRGAELLEVRRQDVDFGQQRVVTAGADGSEPGQR
ncbi:hypothetical protein [Streptomyces sp. NPDC002553]|uniref:hypothetical protein n=1 Tax=Streptomyces sp. NPDC002553 TaxID=3154417 RepID=UPI00332F64FD